MHKVMLTLLHLLASNLIISNCCGVKVLNSSIHTSELVYISFSNNFFPSKVNSSSPSIYPSFISSLNASYIMDNSLILLYKSDS